MAASKSFDMPIEDAANSTRRASPPICGSTAAIPRDSGTRGHRHKSRHPNVLTLFCRLQNFGQIRGSVPVLLASSASFNSIRTLIRRPVSSSARSSRSNNLTESTVSMASKVERPAPTYSIGDGRSDGSGPQTNREAPGAWQRTPAHSFHRSRAARTGTRPGSARQRISSSRPLV